MLDRNTIEDLLPLTPMQSGLLFHTMQEAGQYVEILEYAGSGALDVQWFTEAWAALVQRHEALRTIFITTPKLVQVLLRTYTDAVSVYDYVGKSDDESRSFIESRRKHYRLSGVPLAPTPPFKIELICKSGDSWTMLMIFHHALMDGWCQGILMSEFVELYSARRANRTADLPVAPKFRSFLKWLKSNPQDDAVEFWKKRVAGVRKRRRTLGIADTHAVPAMRSHNVEFMKETCDALRELQHTHHATASDIAQCIWSIALAIALDEDDIVTGTTVSGRPPEVPGTDSMVGCFINMVPTVVRVDDASRVDTVLDTVIKNSRDRLGRDLAPLPEILAGTALASSPIDNILVIENYPFDEAILKSIQQSCGFTFSQSSVDEITNYPLTVQVHVEQQWKWTLQVRTDIVDDTCTSAMLALLPEVAQLLATRAYTTIGEMRSNLHHLCARQRRLRCDLAASFSVDTLVQGIDAWSDRIDLPLVVHAAEYGDVEGALRKTDTTDPLVIVQRFEDWYRHASMSNDIADERFDDMIHNVTRAASLRRVVVVVPPFHVTSESSAEYASHLRKRWLGLLPGIAGVRVVDTSASMAAWGVSQAFDTIADREGHLPYTNDATTVIAGSIVRTLRASVKPPHKVVVVDCDNTLWNGVVGEDGVDGVAILPGHRALQQWLVDRATEGVVIALCSKNEEADVWAVFSQRNDMILKRDHIVEYAINWEPKSKNIEAIAERLNVGLDSFVFLDDSTLECTDVLQHCPQVLTLRVPTDETLIASFVDRLWFCDVWSVTAEDRSRNEMYAGEARRKRAEEYSTDRESFLRQLQLQLEIAPITASSIDRATQLTHRTNQFNNTTLRKSIEEVRAFCTAADTVTACIRLSDRYGAYGIIGVAFMTIHNDVATVESILMSCRALGRGVEYSLMAYLAQQAEQRGCTVLDVPYVPTLRNGQVVPYLEACSLSPSKTSDGSMIFTTLLSRIPPNPSYVQVQVLKSLEADPVATGHKSIITDTVSVDNSLPSVLSWTVDTLLAELTIQHASDVAPMLVTGLGDLRTLQDIVTYTHRAVYSAPDTDIQREVLKAVQEILSVQDIGVDDDFFALGGHSISAIHLVSRLTSSLKVHVSIGDIFSERTIRALSSLIASRTTSSYKQIPRSDSTGSFPMAPAQERIWILSELQPELDYTVSGIVEVDALLDPLLLERSLDIVSKRHDVLRATVMEESSIPTMVLHDELHPEFIICKSVEVSSRIGKPFDLHVGPLFRCVMALGQTATVLGLSIHHIIADGWSLGLLRDEVLEVYGHLSKNIDHYDHLESAIPEGVRYRDYAEWMRAAVDGGHGATSTSYWSKTLSGASDVFLFPSMNSRNNVDLHVGASLTIDIAEDTVASIVDVAQRSSSTPFHIWMTAARLVLDAYSHEPDMVIGTVTSGRDHPDLANVVGMMVNTLPIRTSISGSDTVRQCIKHVSSSVQNALEHSALPFEHIVRAANGKSTSTTNALFEVMFMYQSVGTSDGEDLLSRARVLQEESGAGRFDIAISVLPGKHGTRLRLEYREQLFPHDVMLRLAERIAYVASNLRSNLDARVDSISVLLPSESHQLEGISSGPTRQSIYAPTLTEAVLQAASSAPDAIAVVDTARTWTYRQLEQCIYARMHQIKKHNVRDTGMCIGLAMDRSYDCISMMLAIMGSGCTVVMLDPKAPVERLRRQVATVGVMTIFTSSYYVESLSDILDCDVYAVDEPTDGNTPLPVLKTDVAYVIFTSGSTGIPKAVMGTHAGLMNTLEYQAVEFGCLPGRRALTMAMPTFDAFLSEVGTALIAGATLVCASRDVIDDTDVFAHFLQTHRVDIATIPPAYLRVLAPECLSRLTTLIVAGESVTPHLLEYHIGKPKVINAYGPTECSICVSMHTVKSITPLIPIGKPNPDVVTYIVDRYGRRAPIDSEGVLCVAGPGVSKGYMNDTERTRQVFIPYPPEPRSTMYVTNDIVRYDKDLDMIFLGRRDTQVKINGVRVETGEIESALLQNENVKEAVVTYDTSRGILIGAVISNATEVEIRSELANRLPANLIPTQLILVDTLPRTAHGKTDIAAILARAAGSSTQSRREAFTPTQAIVADLWLDVLGQSPNTIDDDFFVLGGNSLSVLSLVQKLRTYSHRIDPRKIYRYSTLRGMAEVIEAGFTLKADVSFFTGDVPLLPAAAWFLSRHSFEDARHFTLNSARHIDRTIGIDTLKDAVKQMIVAHPALRMQFVTRLDGSICSHVLHPSAVNPPVHEIVVPIASKDVLDRVADSMVSSLNIGSAPLFSLTIVRSPEESILVVVVHHLIADAISFAVLEAELDSILKDGTTDLHNDNYNVATGYVGNEQIVSRVAEHSLLPDPLGWNVHIDMSIIEKIYTSGYSIDHVLSIAASLCLKNQFSATIELVLERTGRDTLPVEASNAVGWFTLLQRRRVSTRSLREGRIVELLRGAIPDIESEAVASNDVSICVNIVPRNDEKGITVGSERSAVTAMLHTIEIDGSMTSTGLDLSIAIDRNSIDSQTHSALQQGFEAVLHDVIAIANRNPKPVILLFPPVGGEHSIYRNVVMHLDSYVDFVYAHYPGHNVDGITEVDGVTEIEPMKSVEEIAKAISSTVLKSSVNRLRPHILVGHSLGGAIAYETMRYLPEDINVAGLIISSFPYPASLPDKAMPDRSDRNDLLNALNTAQRSAVEAGLHAGDTWKGPTQQVDVPLSVISASDEGIDAEYMSAWSTSTTDMFASIRIEGKHDHPIEHDYLTSLIRKHIGKTTEVI